MLVCRLAIAQLQALKARARTILRPASSSRDEAAARSLRHLLSPACAVRRAALCLPGLSRKTPLQAHAVSEAGSLRVSYLRAGSPAVAGRNQRAPSLSKALGLSRGQASRRVILSRPASGWDQRNRCSDGVLHHQGVCLQLGSPVLCAICLPNDMRISRGRSCPRPHKRSFLRALMEGAACAEAGASSGPSAACAD